MCISPQSSRVHRFSKMNCYLCKSRFENKDVALKHLKNTHSINAKVHSLKCVIGNCAQVYYTAQNWRKHVDKCFEKNSVEEILELSNIMISSDTEINNIICEEDAHEQSANASLNLVFDGNYSSDVDEKQQIVFEGEKSESLAEKPKSSTQIAQEFFQKLVRLELNQNVLNAVFHLTTELLQQTNDLCCENLTNKSCPPIESVNATTNLILDDLRQFNSSYKRNKFYESDRKFVKPKEYGIGTHWELKRDKESKVMLPYHVQSKFNYISLLDTISALFSDAEARQTYFDYNQSSKHACEQNVYIDYCCGAKFKNNSFFQTNKNCLQLQIYTDGFEICDGLKTKSNFHSQTAVYFTIRNIPPELAYNQNNIHLLALINSSDLKKRETDYTNVLEIIVRELKILNSNGIDLDGGTNLKGEYLESRRWYTLKYFILTLIIQRIDTMSFSTTGALVNFTFDNLGGNQVLGFAESPGVSYPCRTCLCTKEETQYVTVDQPDKHRTIDSYNEAIEIINNAGNIDYKATKGIREFCVLNELPDFHILDNLNADIMHDLCEGTISILLSNVFKRLVESKMISEKGLNDLVSFFNYGVLNRHHIPSTISFEKKNLNQNASQTKCLLYHLPYIFAEFKTHDVFKDLWTCVHSLLEIVTICYSSKIKESDLVKLEVAVKCHLECMIRTFKIKLIRKHHHMTHCAHIIRNVGPLVHMSALRFETKHKELKKISKTTNNFRNINKTIANRHVERSLMKNVYENTITHGVMRALNSQLQQKFQELLSEFSDRKFAHTKWLQINSHYYEPGLILKYIDFFEILCILRNNEEFYFICSKYEYSEYDAFLNSIIIEKNTPEHLFLLEYSKLNCKKSFEKKVMDDKILLIVDCLDILS